MDTGKLGYIEKLGHIWKLGHIGKLRHIGKFGHRKICTQVKLEDIGDNFEPKENQTNWKIWTHRKTWAHRISWKA